MKIPSFLPRLKGYRYPREVIAYAIWAVWILTQVRQIKVYF